MDSTLAIYAGVSAAILAEMEVQGLIEQGFRAALMKCQEPHYLSVALFLMHTANPSTGLAVFGDVARAHPAVLPALMEHALDSLGGNINTSSGEDALMILRILGDVAYAVQSDFMPCIEAITAQLVAYLEARSQEGK